MEVESVGLKRIILETGNHNLPISDVGKRLCSCLLKQSSIVRWEILIWGIPQKWAKSLPQNAESFIILCSTREWINTICVNMCVWSKREAPTIRVNAYNYVPASSFSMTTPIEQFYHHKLSLVQLSCSFLSSLISTI